MYISLLRTADITHYPLPTLPRFSTTLNYFACLLSFPLFICRKCNCNCNCNCNMAKVSLEDLSPGGSRLRHLFPSILTFSFFSSSQLVAWHFIKIESVAFHSRLWCLAYCKPTAECQPTHPQQVDDNFPVLLGWVLRFFEKGCNSFIGDTPFSFFDQGNL